MTKRRKPLSNRALKREPAEQKRADVDVAFAAMADDPDYQSYAVRMAAEFARSDWEALQLAEDRHR